MIVNAARKQLVSLAWERLNSAMEVGAESEEILSLLVEYRKRKLSLAGDDIKDGKSNYTVKNEALGYECDVHVTKY